MKSYLLLTGIQVHNANAMSSTFTIGIPAITGFMGCMHNLERHIRREPGLENVRFTGVGISFHDTDLQTYQGRGDYEASLIGTANPAENKDKLGERPPFIPEARIHFTVSLLLETEGVDGDNKDKLEEIVKKKLPLLKMAGGDIEGWGKERIYFVREGEEEHKIIRKMMPGYVPIERKDLLQRKSDELQDSAKALLYYLRVTHHWIVEEGESEGRWERYKDTAGWLVPLAVGFQGLSPLGNVDKQRDPTAPHRFVESIVTLGEFKMAHRFEKIEDILWRYAYDEEEQLYVCINENKGEKYHE